MTNKIKADDGNKCRLCRYLFGSRAKATDNTYLYNRRLRMQNRQNTGS